MGCKTDTNIRGSFRKIIKGGGQKWNVADFGGAGGGGKVQSGVPSTPHARGVWGHAPPGTFRNLDPLRSLLVHFQVTLHNL